jgi:transcriptional regulator with XRE-family HTH domain
VTPQTFIAWRKRLGLSQAKAAAALGMGLRQIQKYEAGQADIPLTVRLAMAALALGLSDYPANARQMAEDVEKGFG